jgi:hypothetical protein
MTAPDASKSGRAALSGSLAFSALGEGTGMNGLCALARQFAPKSHGTLAEPGANLVHRMLDPSRPVEFAAEQGRRVGRRAAV